MQEVTPTICGNSYEEETKQLYDIRDAKKYWVAKLADGNCWMVQNLDYDDPDSVIINSTSGTNGGPDKDDWKIDYTIRQYWDPGEKIISNKSLVTPTENIDRHYLVGNYYNWLAATAGTGTDLIAKDEHAINSICPAGWKLPTSGVDEDDNPITTSGSFGGLIAAYNIENNETGSVKLQGPPFYFIFNGYTIGGGLLNVNSEGFLWSSTSRGTSAGKLYTYDFAIFPHGVRPANSDGEPRFGVPIRCLVIGS